MTAYLLWRAGFGRIINKAKAIAQVYEVFEKLGLFGLARVPVWGSGVAIATG